jgi:DNA-binding transcriptional MerR regulator
LLTIGQLASEFGLTLRALRFYESRGFLTPRREGAARLYQHADRARLALVLEAKALGFTLREIGDLIAAGAAGPGSLQLDRRRCVEQINLLERQKREIESALAKLRQVYSGHYQRQVERGEFDRT